MIAQRRFSRRPRRPRLAMTRPLHAELLERRDLLAADWHNEILPADVDYSGHLSVNDALLVVSDLRANGIRDLTDTPPPIAGEPPFLDVNANNIAAVSDALDIVSQLRVGLELPSPGLEVALANDTGVDATDAITFDATLMAQLPQGDVDNTHILARLNGGRWFRPNIATLSDLPIDPGLPADGTADGEHELELVAQTAGGPVDQLSLGFTLDTQGPVIESGLSELLRVTTSTLAIGFNETIDSSTLTVSNVSISDSTGGNQVTVQAIEQTDSSSVEVQLGSKLHDDSFHFSFDGGIRDVAGNELTSSSLLFTVADPTGVTEFRPTRGEQAVRVNRTLRINLDEPVDPSSIDATNFYAISGGEQLAGDIRVGQDGKSVSLFLNEFLPFSSRIRLVVDGNTMLGLDGMPVDVNGDNEPGGRKVIEFETVSNARIEGTSVSGYIKDAYRNDTEGNPLPIVNATVRVEGMPNLFALTDETGRFELQNVPAPEFFVHLDGSTATNAPEGMFYGSTVKPFHSIPGMSVVLNKNGMPFDVFLPLLEEDDATPIVADQMTSVAFSDVSLDRLEQITPEVPHDMWQDLRVEIPANSLFDAELNPATAARIFPLDRERIPVPLPGGANPKIVFSIAAGEAEHFDVPAQITYPNVDGLSPGEKRFIYSFDHDIGQWKPTGTMTVSDDGSVLTSDDGVQTVGWRYVGPAPEDEAEPVPGELSIPEIGGRATPAGNSDMPLDLNVNIPEPVDQNGEPYPEGASVDDIMISISNADAFSFENASIGGIPFESNGDQFTISLEQLPIGSHVFTIEGIEAPDTPQFEQITIDVTVEYNVEDRPVNLSESTSITTALVAERKPFGNSEIANFQFSASGQQGFSFSDTDDFAKAFAPTLFFEEDEEFFPTSVESTLETAIRLTDEQGEPLVFADGTIATTADIGPLDTSLIAGIADANSAIDLVGEVSFAVRRNLKPEPMVYYSVAFEEVVEGGEEPIDRLALTYWMHYGYSNWKDVDGRNNHEGDWERAQPAQHALPMRGI